MKPDHAAQAERLKAVTDKLEAGIKELRQSDRYAAYLQAMAKFYRYSYGNVALILAQYPTASQVAGYHDWKRKFGRNVKKGERGIQILAPCTYTKWERRDRADPDTQRPVLDESGQPIQEAVIVQRRGYRVEYVFDVTQTEGRELPTIHTVLGGDVAQYEAVTAALRKLSPVPIEYAALPSGAYGCFDHLEQKITVRPDMSQTQTLKTTIHEIAHAMLHALPTENGVVMVSQEKSKSAREVEAESVAYVVCQHFGIDTSDYSLGYVAGWSSRQDTAEFKASLACIRNTAAEIIGGIEEKCPELAPPEPEQSENKAGPKPRRQKHRRSVR